MIKILLVDDEIYARDNMARLIQRRGFDVCVAGNADECLKTLKEENPDVIFLDIMLPDLDGDHLFHYIKEVNSSALIYFITGSGTIFTEEHAKELGAQGYMQKPVYVENLFALLDELKSKIKKEEA
ncbi:MAG: response regulator [Endomicrobium sp.]|jgi:DNA-binding response OmpR family regulator|nr:response regulator [Endomicrobium sp.]